MNKGVRSLHFRHKFDDLVRNAFRCQRFMDRRLEGVDI